MFEAFKLKKRVSDLEETLARIESAFKKLEIEWTDTYDKFRHLHWRVAKRVKQLEASDPESSTATEAQPESPSDSPGLSGPQAVWQARILARRQKMRLGGG